MTTLKQEIIYFNDEFGRILPGAKIFTYESETTTQKATYTSGDLSSANQWPVVADGRGVFPPIFLESGAYRIVVTDEDDVQQFARDEINAAETTILTTSDIYFSTLIDAKQGIAIDGSSVNLQVGQIARTAGKNTSSDGEGAEWLVVAGGTGTPDDDLYADLDNGNQLQRLFNQLYTDRDFGEFADGGEVKQQSGRDNLLPDNSDFFKMGGSWVAKRGTYNPTIIDFATVFASGALFATVGPSGSGADYEWPELDVVPLSSRSIRVSIDNLCINNAGDVAEVIAYARLNGGSSSPKISHTLVRAGGATRVDGRNVTEATIPLDSNNVFEFRYNSLFTTSESLFMTIVEYGA